MIRKLFLPAATIVTAIITLSCSDISVYNSNIDIPGESWNIDSIARFKVDIADTTSIHNVYVSVRNTTNYPNSNLYLFISTTSPQGASLRDTLEYILADSKGNWLGKGVGAIRDNQIPYKRYIRFPDVGTYEFTIQQGMRTHHLKGITSIGIRIEKQKP